MPSNPESLDLTATMHLLQAALHAVLALVLFGLHALYRRRFLLHWAGSWATLALSHLATQVLASQPGANSLLVSAALQGCGLLSVALLFSGTWLLASGRGIDLGGWFLTVALPFTLGTVLVLAARSADFETRLVLRTGLPHLVRGLAFLAAAAVVAHLARRDGSLARWLAVAFLALAGLTHAREFLVAVRREGPELDGIGEVLTPYFVLLYLELLLALSLLAWFFEDERRQLVRTARQLSEKEEHLRRSEHLEAVGRLAGGVAHDFNNLLTAITGHAELLLSRKHEGDPDREDLVPIARASDRAAGLVRQLLTFSRRLPVRPRRFVPDRKLAEMRHMLARLLGENVRLELALESDAATLHADPAQIELAVLNLVTNGRDAMPGGGTLRLATRRVTLGVRESAGLAPGNYLELAVGDTGCGIPPEVLGKVFEPFFTTKQGKGTGLGLASVYGVARAAGGDVRVESEVGRGTTFRVLLPLDERPLEPERELQPRAPVRGGGETILLVEDEVQVRELAQRLLTRAGYRVLVAEQGAEALAVARTTNFELVLSDVVMPGMRVLDLLEELRALRPELAVLLMSGYSEAHLRSLGVEGDAPFLAKPFTTEALLAAVRDTLDRRARVTSSRA